MTLFVDTRPYDGSAADAVVQGAPWDGGVSFRAGAAEAPEQVRALSQSIESWSPRVGRDLLDIDVADAGDVDLEGLDAAGTMERIAARTAELAAVSGLVLTLGGDHSISIGTSRGLRARHPELAHLVFDAHMDLRPEYEGSVYSHACGTNHMAASGPTCVLGVRSGSRTEFEQADHLLTAWSDTLELPPAMRLAIAERPLFLSVDLDVLDPGVLPGTGNPEPGGVSYRELREALLGFVGHRVVGIDLVEVHPRLDPSGVSAVVAAALARDLMLAFARSS